MPAPGRLDPRRRGPGAAGPLRPPGAQGDPEPVPAPAGGPDRLRGRARTGGSAAATRACRAPSAPWRRRTCWPTAPPPRPPTGRLPHLPGGGRGPAQGRDRLRPAAGGEQHRRQHRRREPAHLRQHPAPRGRGGLAGGPGAGGPPGSDPGRPEGDPQPPGRPDPVRDLPVQPGGRAAGALVRHRRRGRVPRGGSRPGAAGHRRHLLGGGRPAQRAGRHRPQRGRPGVQRDPVPAPGPGAGSRRTRACPARPPCCSG